MQDRVDISIDTDKLAMLATPEMRADPKRLLAFINDFCATVKDTIASLGPDEVYVHSSLITVNHPLVCSCGANDLR